MINKIAIRYVRLSTTSIPNAIPQLSLPLGPYAQTTLPTPRVVTTLSTADCDTSRYFDVSF